MERLKFRPSEIRIERQNVMKIIRWTNNFVAWVSLAVQPVMTLPISELEADSVCITI